MLEAAWPARLGFSSTTILRSREELTALVEQQPFGELEHGPTSYLLVTFSKASLADVESEVPRATPDLRILGATERELFTVTDTTTGGTPDVMSQIERRYGRNVSSRTWLTVGRILKRMA